MNRSELIRQFKSELQDVYKQYPDFKKARIFKVSFSNDTSFVGKCTISRCNTAFKFSFSLPILMLTPNYLTNCIRHELAHAVAAYKHRKNMLHSAAWRNIAESLGCTVELGINTYKKDGILLHAKTVYINNRYK